MSEAGPGWQSPVHSWRLEQCPYAPARGHEFEIRRWKTLRALKAAALACRLWKGFLVPSKARSATEGRVGRAARQGASGVWSATSCKADKAEREGCRAERTVSGHGPDGGRLIRAPAGASGAKRGATRGRTAPVVVRHLRVRKGSFPRRQSSRRKGAAPEAAVGRVRALRSGAWVPQGARDNCSVAEVGERHLLPDGRPSIFGCWGHARE